MSPLSPLGVPQGSLPGLEGLGCLRCVDLAPEQRLGCPVRNWPPQEPIPSFTLKSSPWTEPLLGYKLPPNP